MVRPTGESEAEDKFRHAVADFISEHRELRLRTSELKEDLLDAQRYRKLRYAFTEQREVRIDELFEKLLEDFDVTADSLPPAQKMTLVTPNTHCLICNRRSRLVLCKRCAGKEAARQEIALVNGLRIESLRPLLDSQPNLLGEEYVEVLSGKKKAICFSCGARDDMVMIRKHKKDCKWVAYWKALELLRQMLDTKPASAACQKHLET
jgi:hypothetical protein